MYEHLRLERRMTLILLAILGCTGAKPDDSASDTDTNTGLDPVCEQPAEVGCVDQMILDLSLHDDKISKGDVVTTTEGSDFVTTVDASAGGFGNETKNAWVYVKFTTDGATKVELDDESALESESPVGCSSA